MKKTLTSFAVTILASAVLLLSSCDKAKDLVKVNVAMQSADISFIIHEQPAGTQTLAEFTTLLNVDSLIKSEASSMGISNIKSVKIKSCTFELINSDAQNHFGALSACKAQLFTNANNTVVTLAEIINNSDAAASKLDLPVNADLELKNYFSGTSFYYKISGTTRRATNKPLQARATIKFNVQVGL